MARIKITKFGGIAPSVDPRNLSDDGAQTALNLDLRFGDFRPTKGLGESIATVPSGTKSIFRTPSGVWLNSPTSTNWVNGQIPDATSERVYLTGRSAFPEAWQSGSFRRLGVPAPTTKPEVTIVANSEFDQTAATMAQAAATAAVLAAIDGTTTPVLLGNAPPVGIGGVVTTPDTLYPQVALHLRFDALVGGLFVDSSPQGRVIAFEAGVTQVTGSGGPLGAGGTGYAALAGGTANGITFAEITRQRDAADPTWTIDAWVTSTSTLDFLQIECRDGHVREINFVATGGGGAFKTLFSSNYGGTFSMQLRAQRPGGAAALAAGVPAFISIQNNGTCVQAYIDGVLIGSTPNPEGLELSNIGRASWTNTRAFVGKIDEVRVTMAARYSGNFTPPTGPFSTALAPTGFWVQHGDVLAVGLPTDASTDVAYVFPLTLTSGAYLATNAGDAYLLAGSLGGSQITYSGSPYWAIPVRTYRANGKSTTQSLLDAALALVDNPASPGTPLLTSGQATALAALIFPLFNPAVPELLTDISDTNTRQAELRLQLATVPGDAVAIGTKIGLLKTATKSITDYFAAMESAIKTILVKQYGTLFGSIQAAVVTRDVQTRTYIVTYLTDWDEESAPSPAADLLSVDQNDAITVVAPAPPAGRNIVGWRLYRSATSSTGASWALVADTTAPNAILRDGVFFGFLIGSRVYSDSLPDEKLQEPCQTITWAEPPENLQGLVGMPNGIMVGFYDKTVCFSESFAPYAWPREYQLTVGYKIVGIGVFGQTAVVLTEGFPSYVSGADPASMSEQKIEVPQACMAAGSIATVDGGVVFASPDGLCLASASGVAVLTEGAFSKVDWQATVSSGAVGAFHDGAYYLFTD